MISLYVRSWRGPAGARFHAVQQPHKGHISAGGLDKDVLFVEVDDQVNDAIDSAYRTKYRKRPTYVPPMIGADARATTIRLVPR